MATEGPSERILALARAAGAIRTRDVAALGIAPGAALHRLVQRGQLERVGRGLYMLPDFAVTEHHTKVEVAKRVPNGVICLLSALRFHELGTQLPFEVWLAIEGHAHRPQLDWISLRVFRMSGPAFSTGIETHVIEGVPVRVYSAAKTVVDCFKFRNKVGIDVAIEALHDYIRKRGSLDELWRCAQACRVARIMRPYIEASL